MKILVIGERGQVARCLVDATIKYSEITIIALGRSHMNVADVNQIKSAFGAYDPDLVINAAAYTSVDMAESESQLASQINAIAPGVLAQLCEERSIPLIHLSTDYVFDGQSEQPYTASCQTSPLGIYGSTKLAGELAVRANCEKHLIVRTSWVFSEYGNNFVKTMLRLASEKSELDIVGDQIGRPTDAFDIANALLIMAQAKEPSWGTYHFVGSTILSWHDFANSIFNEAFSQGHLRDMPKLCAITTAEYPTAAKRPAWSVLDMSNTTAVFGLEPIPLSQSLNRVIKQLSGNKQFKLPNTGIGSA